MADADVLALGKTNRLRPSSITPESIISDDPIRLGPYREQYNLNLFPGKQVLAEEGSYFYVTNPTIGTGVAHAVLTSFTETSALFAIYNARTDARIILDFLRLTIVGTVPATKLTEEILVQVDSQAIRTPTANLLQQTPVSNVLGYASGATVYAFAAGLLTVPSGANTARRVSRGKIPLNVAIAHDVYTFQFGGADYGQQTAPLTAVRAVQAAGFIAHCAPVVIEPNCWGIIYRYGAGEATNANTYEYELGWSER